MASGAWYLPTALYLALCVLYIQLGLVTYSRPLKLVLKCLPIVILISWVFVFLVSLQVDRDSGIKLDSEKDTRAAKQVIELPTLVFALVFSVIGDGLLVFPKVFPFGILSFAVAQCAYIRLFGLDLTALLSISWQGWAVFVLFGVNSLTFLIVFQRRIQRVATSPIPFMSPLLCAVYVYFILLSFMLWSSVLRFQAEADLVSFVGFLGGSLFYISDILIAVTAAWKVHLLQGRGLIMISYYSAQFAIVLSFL